jgi:hypothetical protein
LQDQNITRLKPDMTEISRDGLALSADANEADVVGTWSVSPVEGCGELM